MGLVDSVSKYHCPKCGIEYFQSDDSINYLEVSYSDAELEKYVEGNPNVLRNIDGYLRNKLLKQEYSYNYL